jgi:hypothetical protein
MFSSHLGFVSQMACDGVQSIILSQQPCFSFIILKPHVQGTDFISFHKLTMCTKSDNVANYGQGML